MRKHIPWAVAALALAVPGLASAQTAAPTAGPLQGQPKVDINEWNYQELYAEGWRAEELLEATVYGPIGDEIGDVENIIVGPDGRILSVIAEVGGLWDIGDTHVNIPWDQLQFTAGAEGVRVPVTEETVEDYSLFRERTMTAAGAASAVQKVGDEVETGPRAWKLSNLTQDYVRLGDGSGYGYVDDVVFNRKGEIKAVIVQPDVGYGTRGYYAYPFWGWGAGWEPGLDYYDLPYQQEEIGRLEPFDYERLESGLFDS